MSHLVALLGDENYIINIDSHGHAMLPRTSD